MSGRCEQERTLFVACSTLSLFLFLYVTMATQWLLDELEDEPRYLLHAPKNYPSGAFYTTGFSSGGGRAAQQPIPRPGPPELVGQAVGFAPAGGVQQPWPPGSAPQPPPQWPPGAGLQVP